MSVPHSGTRTLVRLLTLPACPKLSISKGAWIHFALNDSALNLRPFTHIPIRHPMDVARSWGQRPKAGNMPLALLLKSYARMFDWLDEYPGLYRLYRMESFPRLAGTDDHKEAPETSDKITRYQETIREKVVEPRREFFARFYGDLDGS